MEFVLGVGMENQLLNCLFSNLMGLGKQLFPQAQAGASSEGQTNAFFDILSQRMGGNVNLLLSVVPEGTAKDDGKAAGGEGVDSSLCPVAASLDPEEIPVLVSSLISAMGGPVFTDEATDMSEADRAAMREFLEGILEILSGDGDGGGSDGDMSFGLHLSAHCAEEIPFTSRETVAAIEADLPEELVGGLSGAYYFDYCDAWRVPPADARENEPVSSGVPTLVMAGGFDPIELINMFFSLSPCVCRRDHPAPVAGPARKHAAKDSRCRPACLARP